MSEFFTRPPDLPEEELSRPKIIPPETAFTRFLATVLMIIWACWWWQGLTDGAYWIIAAAAIFATGETLPHLYRPFLPLWWLLALVVMPLARILLTVVRFVIPEAYRRPTQVQKPLSFKQINEALDEAAAKKERQTDKSGTEDHR